jgi:hypothetical protein
MEDHLDHPAPAPFDTGCALLRAQPAIEGGAPEATLFTHRKLSNFMCLDRAQPHCQKTGAMLQFMW